MLLTDLPEELLCIISNDMNQDIICISKVNKEFNYILKERLNREKKIALIKQAKKDTFFSRFYCKSLDRLWPSFHEVQNLEECDFVKEEYCKRYGQHSGFLSRVGYIMGNTYQVQTEVWMSWMKSLESS